MICSIFTLQRTLLMIEVYQILLDGYTFHGCVSERVVSSFCWLTARILCQFWRPRPPSRENTKHKGLIDIQLPIYKLAQEG